MSLATKAENVRNAAMLRQLTDETTTHSQRDVIAIQFALQVAATPELFEPKPIPRSSLSASMSADDMQDIRRKIAGGLRVEPDERRASSNYAHWREAVTLAESDNRVRLRTLIRARNRLRETGDSDMEAVAHRLDQILHSAWNLGQVPVFDSRVELDQWCLEKTRDYRVLPRAWRWL